MALASSFSALGGLWHKPLGLTYVCRGSGKNVDRGTCINRNPEFNLDARCRLDGDSERLQTCLTTSEPTPTRFRRTMVQFETSLHTFGL